MRRLSRRRPLPLTTSVRASIGREIVGGGQADDSLSVQIDAGATSTVAQVGADTVIDMGAGDQMVLVNVQLSALPAGWIFTG